MQTVKCLIDLGVAVSGLLSCPYFQYTMMTILVADVGFELLVNRKNGNIEKCSQ